MTSRAQCVKGENFWHLHWYTNTYKLIDFLKENCYTSHTEGESEGVQLKEHTVSFGGIKASVILAFFYGRM